MFLKNTASQAIHAQINSRTDGAPLTSAVSVAVKVDNGTQAAGSGTLAHIANGLWQYVPTQAETNGDVISYQFTHATGVNANVEVVTAAGDAFTRLGVAGAGLTALGDTRLGNLDATVSSRNATTPPTAAAIRAEIDTNSTKLVNLDVPVSTRNATTPPTAAAIRTELDANSTKLVNLDVPVSTRSTYAGTDTPGTTTLLGRIASALNLTAGKVDVNDKTGFSLTAGEHTNIGTDVRTGLTAQGYTTTRAGFLDVLNGLVASVWAYTARTLTAFGFTVGTTDAGNIGAIKAKTDNLPVAPAAEGSPMTLTSAYDAAKTAGNATAANQTAILQAMPAPAPTAAEVADKFLNRNLAGGSDGGRTVKDSLRVSRNKVVINGTSITVYAEDDVTVAWTGTLTTDPTAAPITGVDPA